jgi:hypothetical protein
MARESDGRRNRLPHQSLCYSERVPLARRAVFLAATLLAGAYYFWCARVTGHPFQWGYDLGGYYNYLARGLQHRHLYVPIEPSPKLLALPDPYAPGVDDALKVWDMALYRGHYYLYHGIAPAVLLFLPWRLVTGHDVPENFALALFCTAGFLFSTGALMRVLTLADAKVSPTVLALLLAALAVCQGAPFLLSRVWVYEVAIGCGYCTLSAALYFLAGGRAWELAASGLMCGLSIACRPHLGLAAVIATAALAVHFTRKRNPAALLAFLAPLIAIGLAIMAYNYARFGHPLDFGVRYLLGNPGLSRTQLAGRWFLPGLYYFLICPPNLGPVFPWVRIATLYPLHPEGYFVEPTTGCLYLAPFLVGILFLRRTGGARIVLAVALATSVAVLLFVAGTGFTTQRYEVDFLPPAALAAAAGFALAIARRSGWQRRALIATLALLVSGGMIAGMAIAVTGPLDDFLKARPQPYTRLAAGFSPIARYRPLLDSPLDIQFTAACTPHDDGFREPLLSIGDHTFSEIVAIEHHPGRFRVIAQSDASGAAQEIGNPGARPMSFHIVYQPDSHKITVTLDGTEVLTHNVEHLLTAPAQVTIGENRIDPDVSTPVFTGRLEHIAGGIK